MSSTNVRLNYTYLDTNQSSLYDISNIFSPRKCNKSISTPCFPRNLQPSLFATNIPPPKQEFKSACTDSSKRIRSQQVLYYVKSTPCLPSQLDKRTRRQNKDLIYINPFWRMTKDFRWINFAFHKTHSFPANVITDFNFWEMVDALHFLLWSLWCQKHKLLYLRKMWIFTNLWSGGQIKSKFTPTHI